jgi:hypothetical protein
VVVAEGLIQQVILVTNPDKLGGIAVTGAPGQGGPPAGARREPASGGGPGGSFH